jgi:hypothetical protein
VRENARIGSVALIVAFGVIGSASRGHAKHGAIARFRRGLIIDYPTDAANRARSCIFIHIQKKNPTSGTARCFNLPENRVAASQKFTKKHPTMLAQIPQNQRLAG